MKSFIYRIIAMVLVISVSISSMIFSVSAAEIEPAMKVTNLLDGSYFDFYIGDQFIGRYTGTTSNFVGVSATWSWNTNPNLYYDVISIVISGDRPSSLSITQNGLTRACLYEGSVGDQHMYSFHSHALGDNLQLTATYSSSDRHYFNLVSVFGYYDVSENITTLRSGSRYYNTVEEGWSDIKWRSSSSLPAYFGNEGIPMNSRNEAIFEVRPSDRQTEYPESISFLVRINGVNPSFGASLVESSTGNPVTVLSGFDVQNFGYGVYDTDYGINSNLRYQWYLVTFDLTGYDIAGKTIRFTCGADIDQGYLTISLFACSISALVVDNPNFWGRLYLWLSDIYDGIVSVGQNIVDAIKGSSETEQQLESAGAAMNEQAQEFNDAQSSLDSVSRPELDADQMFGSFLNFDNHSLVLLASITSNPYVTGIMLVVFTFALCGYVFFGKKK